MTLISKTKFEWGLVINTSNKTVDVVKSSYRDTVVKTLPWIEGYSLMNMVIFCEECRKKRGYNFLEVCLC